MSTGPTMQDGNEDSVFVDLDDNEHSLSNTECQYEYDHKIVLSKPIRCLGNWRAYYLMPFKSIIDWLCPRCKMTINFVQSGRAICPNCGLTVGEFPPSKYIEPRNRREHISNWKEWINEALSDE